MLPDRLRILLHHPLAAPTILTLLAADLWFAVPPSGVAGGSWARSLYWTPPTTALPSTCDYDAFFNRLGPDPEGWRFVATPWFGSIGSWASMHLSFTTGDEARGFWAITRIERLDRVVVSNVQNGQGHATDADLAAARRLYVQHYVSAVSPLPPASLTALETHDLSEVSIAYTGYLHNAASLLLAAALPSSLYGLITYPARARRAARLVRGLCPRCGYDLAGNASNVCPECGHSP
jgi:hypothetical protein